MSIRTASNLLKSRRTKIIATIGPSTDSEVQIKKLIQHGVNIFRLNMSHGDQETHAKVFNMIRAMARQEQQHIAILADLCGPKIRTGKFIDGAIELIQGSDVTVTTRDVMGEPGLIPSQYQSLADDVKPGNRILLNDGALELLVKSIDDTEIQCMVIHGGKLKDKKGINLPGVQVSAPSLTNKDRSDAEFMLELGVDFLALSFVRTAADIRELRDLIQAQHGNTHIVAKIEKPEALENADEIIDASDAIMVARGDLGVELNPEQVPVAQGQLIHRARKSFKPVIVATQMLESMIENARPTRAEVTDIAHAVTLGTDAVMLSAETAAGAYPLESVNMMDRIVRQTEAHLWESGAYGINEYSNISPIPVWEAIAKTTAHLSKDLQARAVIVISQTGTSAATVSSARPAAPVVCITQSDDICRKLAIQWSVIALQDDAAGTLNPNVLARNISRQQHLAEHGETVLLVRGFHADPELNTPSVTVIEV